MSFIILADAPELMRIGRNMLHYAKFIGILAVILMIWLTSRPNTGQPHFAGGQPKITGAFVEGKAEGTWTWWYESGNKMTEGNFVAGKRNNVWRTWYEDGSLKSESTYQDDRLNGSYKQFHKNGKVKQSGNYVQDRREGIFMYFDTAGVMLEKKLYANGVLETK